MTPSFDKYPPNTVIQGDCREVLRDFPNLFIDLIVTSPPYWDLRDYTGGNEAEIGREHSPDEFIDNLVSVFREAHSKMKESGAVWVNIADTYRDGVPMRTPWKFCDAMLADGWYLINTVIWYKIDAMAESTVRRFSQKYEPFFFFVKDPDVYYFNYDAATIPAKVSSVQRLEHKFNTGKGTDISRMKSRIGDMSHKVDALLEAGVNAGDIWPMPTNKVKVEHAAPYPVELCMRPIMSCCPPGGVVFDPFTGSGTTGVATLDLGGDRVFYGSELNPLSVEEATKRIEPSKSQLSLF